MNHGVVMLATRPTRKSSNAQNDHTESKIRFTGGNVGPLTEGKETSLSNRSTGTCRHERQVSTFLLFCYS
jgi:hypothetical protein